MRVTVAFNDLTAEEASDFGDAFWLADSASNRKLAEAAWASGNHGANSAVFQSPTDPAQPADVIERLNEIDLHHPNWREIEVSGVAWTPELAELLVGRGITMARNRSGIVFRR